MNKPLLSICIATYNDPKGAERALKSIVPQATPEVEILIRDDSPGTETKELVKKYQSKATIRYIKGEKIGLDRVIIFITEEARGKYVWWFGDDVIVEGAVNRVLQLLKSHPDLSFVWAHFRVIGNEHRARNLGKDRFFEDRNQVIGEIKSVIGFISSTILRRDLALSGIESAKRHIGTAFVNLYLVFHVLSQGGKFYFISGPCVICYPPPKEHFYDGFSTFAVHFFNIANSFKDVFDSRALKKMLAWNLKNILKGILVSRAKGHTTGYGSFSIEKLRTLFGLYWNFLEFWVALPFLIMPRFALNVLYKFYKKISVKS